MFSLSPKITQLSFESQLAQVQSIQTNSPRKFLKLLGENFDIYTFIPDDFKNKYYSSETNKRDYSLESILSSLLLMHFFNVASVPNFILMLTFSKEIREFCHFDNNKVPNASVFSKFKTTFDFELKCLFDNLALRVIDIFENFNNTLADNDPLKNLNTTLIYDTTGLEPKVKENNPKMIQNEIKKQCNYKKYHNSQNNNTENFNPYSAAYKNLPKHAYANDSIKLDFANGHYGYFYKFGMLTNGFGIPLHVQFFGDDFYNKLSPSFNSMEDQKFSFDNASLKPVLSSFFDNVGSNKFSTFMADSEFDSCDNYSLLNYLGFNKVLIPINVRNSNKSDKVSFPLDSEFVPACTKFNNEPFIYDGVVKGKNRSFRIKFVCPKSVKIKSKWSSTCTDKCRHTNSTVTTYVYPNGNLRHFFGVQRGSHEWNESYKRRTIIERSFSTMKSNFFIETPKTTNLASMRSDVFLNSISKLITVILAHSINHPEYISNLSKLLKVC